MKRTLAALVLLLLASAANAQLGPSSTWPPTFGSSSTQPTPPAPNPSQSPPQAAPLPATPIFPAPGTASAPASVPAANPTAPGLAPSPGSVASPANSGFDYSPNVRSGIFGAKMFTGNFLQSTASLFNPNYVVAIGDQLQVRLWGAYQLDSLLTVDAQGNIFLQQVGPVRVAGVLNQSLPKVLEEAMRRTFKSNVYSYVSLAAAQPVRVFVTGFVNRPGMYQGTSTDSVLRYLDQAGGIDPDRGSFLDIKVQRGSLVRGQFNLYDFLLRGVLPAVQLADGDVVVVAPRQKTFVVGGFAENTNRFEFSDSPIEMSRLLALARPFPSATHMRVTRNTGTIFNVDYYPLSEAGKVRLEDGDQVDFTSDKRPGTISVRVEGEHLSAQEYSLPYGSRLQDVMKLIKLTESSDIGNVQLFRLSVQSRQSVLLQNSLKSLEQAVLTARSGTTEEAQLRKAEADLMLSWTARVRDVRPLGQVVIAQSQHREDLLLENGDRINIPVKDGLVLTHGEVLFPTAVAYDSGYAIEERSGGYSQNADTSRIIIAHRDGTFGQSSESSNIRSGDDVLVLPKLDSKPRQFWKDIMQIIFQAALAAKVVLQ